MSTKPAYRPDIDGLRAVAVSSVVVFHAFPSALPGGFIGVDIFFVISGYLISGHIVQGMSAGDFSLARFYERRIRRIFPALLLVLSACLSFGWFALMANEYEQLGKHAAAGAGFVANLVLWQEIGYFDNSGITKPLLHLWSLGIEEQFYIIWPVLVWAGWKLRANMLALILVVAFLSWSLNLSTTGPDESAAFYSPQTRFWELLIGAALAELERRGQLPRSALLANALSISGCALLAFGLLYINEKQAFPGMLAAIPTLGAALVIAAGPSSFLSRYVFSNRLAVGVGLISYPLYLWHWPLLSFAYIIGSQTPDRGTRIALVVAALVAATATYFLVERPIRFGRWKSAQLSLPLLIGMLAVGGAGYLVFAQAGVQNRTAVQDTLKVSSQFVGPMWAYTQNENCTSRYHFPETENYGWWFCMLEEQAAPTVLITGGSFANQLYPGLATNPEISKQNFLSIGTCAPLHFEGQNGPTTTIPCSGPYWSSQNKFIEEVLQREPSIRTVIVGGLAASDDAIYLENAARRLEELSATGAEIIVFSPHIKRDIDVRGCFSRPFSKPSLSCDISQEQYTALLSENEKLEQYLKQRVPGVLFFEQNQAFCSDGACSLVDDGFPLIRDEYFHLSEHASGLVGAAFARWSEVNYPAMLQSSKRPTSE